MVSVIEKVEIESLVFGDNLLVSGRGKLMYISHVQYFNELGKNSRIHGICSNGITHYFNVSGNQKILKIF